MCDDSTLYLYIVVNLSHEWDCMLSPVSPNESPNSGLVLQTPRWMNLYKIILILLQKSLRGTQKITYIDIDINRETQIYIGHIHLIYILIYLALYNN